MNTAMINEEPCKYCEGLKPLKADGDELWWIDVESKKIRYSNVLEEYAVDSCINANFCPDCGSELKGEKSYE